MASADFWRFSCISLCRLSLYQTHCPMTARLSARPPRVRDNNLRPIYLLYLHPRISDSIGLCFDMQTRPYVAALYTVSVRQTGTLPPTSFRLAYRQAGSSSRGTPLSLANDSYYQGSQRTSTSKLSPMPGAQNTIP
jgi:hypothetical protein